MSVSAEWDECHKIALFEKLSSVVTANRWEQRNDRRRRSKFRAAGLLHEQHVDNVPAIRAPEESHRICSVPTSALLSAVWPDALDVS